MALYPLFADLRGLPVLVVGGGPVAQRKVVRLLAAGAVVTVGAPVLTADLDEWAKTGRIARRIGRFEDGWLDGQWLAIAASDDHALNRAVAAAGHGRRVFVNAVDDAQFSRFHVPTVIDRVPVQVAISSGGASPVLARLLRERIEARLDRSLGPLARLLNRFRARIRTRHADAVARRHFYTRIIDGPVAALLRRGQHEQAETALRRSLAAQPAAAKGSVALVGAGPGDPGLLTLRALRALGEADVILHDRLVGSDVLGMARRDALYIDVGKRTGAAAMGQSRIHNLMLDHASAGRRVVRLKGGDPFVFGRGGEELEFLRAHGIDYEVVPGITAALACAAHAGIPLTHREHAQSVRFVTAHCRDSLDTLDWRSLAAERQTLAIYMGVGQLEALRDRLIAHGRAASTPFALIENGSMPDQRVIVGTLAQLPERASRHAAKAPALLILGEVAVCAEHLHWFGAAPLGAAAEGDMRHAA